MPKLTIYPHILDCPKGYTKVKSRCLRMTTDYELVNTNHNAEDTSAAPLTFSKARTKCGTDGNVASMTNESLADIRNLLKIWRHDVEFGDIWVQTPGTECGIIHVSAERYTPLLGSN